MPKKTANGFKLTLEEISSQCMLCYKAPCTSACLKGNDPAKFIRSIRFENSVGASESINIQDCATCNTPCEKSCILENFHIKDMVNRFNAPKKFNRKVDLSINFCGVNCENPFFLSSSVVASNYDMCARALDMGLGWCGF